MARSPCFDRNLIYPRNPMDTVTGRIAETPREDKPKALNSAAQEIRRRIELINDSRELGDQLLEIWE